MVTIEFQHAVVRVYFDGGLIGAGKIIRKSKTYRNIAEYVAAEATMQAIIASSMFEVNGAPLESSKGAHIVERNVTELVII